MVSVNGRATTIIGDSTYFQITNPGKIAKRCTYNLVNYTILSHSPYNRTQPQICDIVPWVVFDLEVV